MKHHVYNQVHLPTSDEERGFFVSDEVTDRGRSKLPLFSSDFFFSTLKPQPLKVAGNCTTEMGKFISFRKIHFTMI